MPRDVPPSKVDWRLTETWRRTFGRIAQRNVAQRQRKQDKRDALIYETKKRLKREGWIK